jgi:hypothetical protein
MADLQFLKPVEMGSLSAELDVFDDGRTASPDLIEKYLYPPLPICSDTLIWGFRILRAALRLQLDKLSCLFIPSCSRVEMLKLALKLENRAGGFNWPEKERMWRHLTRRGDRAGATGSAGAADDAAAAEPFADLSPLIEGRPDPKLADKVRTFSLLPQELKILVAEGQVDLKSAARIRKLPGKVFSGLRASSLTFSQRRQFLNELFEVSCRGGLAPAEITELADRAFRETRPLDAIHKLRFPTLTALETRFSVLEEQLFKGSGVRIQPPPYFEGNSFMVEFGFNSTKSFARKLGALRRLEGRLDALLQLLH